MAIRRTLFLLASLVALGTIGTLLIGFVWPDRPPTEFTLGRVEDFAPGDVASFYLPGDSDELRRLEPDEVVGPGCGWPSVAEWRSFTGTVIHLVRLEDGRFVALSGRSAHLGEMVTWSTDRNFDGRSGWFYEPCHGDTYDVDGTRVFGPAPRGLYHFRVEVRSGRVVVDIADVEPQPTATYGDDR